MSSSYKYPQRVSDDKFSFQEFRATPSNGRLDFNYLQQCSLALSTQSLFQHYETGVVCGGYSVINTTNQNILVLDRHNRVRLVPPSFLYNNRYNASGSIIIETVIGGQPACGQNDKVNKLKEYGKRLPAKDNIERNSFDKAHPALFTNGDLANVVLQYDFTNVMLTFQENHGAFYHYESDLVIIHGEDTNGWLHPATLKSERHWLNPVLPDPSVKTLDFQLLINDPDNTYGRAFINLAGFIMEIPISRDHSEKVGVYLGTRAQPDCTGEMVFQHYPLNATETPFRIYHTREDAETYGNPDKAAEFEIQRLRMQSTAVKLDADIERTTKTHELSKETLEAERIRTQAEAEVAAMKAKLEVELNNQRLETEKLKLQAEVQTKLAVEQAKVEEIQRQQRVQDELNQKRLKAEQEAAEAKARQDKLLAEEKLKHQKELQEQKARADALEQRAREEKIRWESENNYRSYRRQEKVSTADFFRKAILESIKVIGAVAAAVTGCLALYKTIAK